MIKMERDGERKVQLIMIIIISRRRTCFGGWPENRERNIIYSGTPLYVCPAGTADEETEFTAPKED